MLDEAPHGEEPLRGRGRGLRAAASVGLAPAPRGRRLRRVSRHAWRLVIRPSVSVVVPFRGNEGDARRLAGNLSRLELRDDDELIVADNSGETSSLQFPSGGEGTLGLVVPATGERVHRITRATSARPPRATTGFSSLTRIAFRHRLYSIPTSTRDRMTPSGSSPAPSPPIPTRTRSSPATRRAAELRADQDTGLHTAGDAAATANLMVRREAFEAIGGFTEGIRARRRRRPLPPPPG